MTVMCFTTKTYGQSPGLFHKLWKWKEIALKRALSPHQAQKSLSWSTLWTGSDEIISPENPKRPKTAENHQSFHFEMHLNTPWRANTAQNCAERWELSLRATKTPKNTGIILYGINSASLKSAENSFVKVLGKLKISGTAHQRKRPQE